ncbi:hypothetical protein BDR26DRAFT_936159 [Obelidium mucronatum]|nr:hypothetical protein BDR26DRAFT_936159 [Obelidium mucronatum]
MSNATTTTTDNVTPIASTVALPIIVCAFLGGLACENAIRGIWLSICQIRENPNQNLSAKIILCCNIVIVIDVVIYQWSNASVESTCYVVSLLGEAFYHLFMVIFGGYLLFKTWMALNKRPVFFIFASVLLVNRIAWAAAESYLSYGSWNSDSEACEWHSNVTLMTG